jgi:histidinol dehydrogenase
VLPVEDLRGTGRTPEFPRALSAVDDLRLQVREIVEQVRDQGDAAAMSIQARVGVAPERLLVSRSERQEAMDRLDPGLRSALEAAAERIQMVHERQLETLPDGTWRTGGPGSTVGERSLPLDRAGCYVPGGRASYPSSVLMTAIPARIAGVRDVIVCCPPAPGGRIHAATLAACVIAGVDEVYAIGGAQAIAAMAYGTQTIAPVDVIVGPGNSWVTLAKLEVAHRVRVDGFQGPTEIAIIADETAPPLFIAADLVAQAEHDPLATCLLITPNEELVGPVLEAVEKEAASHPRADDVTQALTNHGRIYLVDSLQEAARITNEFAPEHLELAVARPDLLIDAIRNAGAIFSGIYSPVSLGDYLAGTNHVLPTAGSARYTSPLGVSTFRRSTGLIAFGAAGLERVSPALIKIAEAEGLVAHARAVQVRLES